MPKLVDHVSYRKHLLAHCLDLFAERGYSALTMRQIAEALNVSTGTLYEYAKQQFEKRLARIAKARGQSLEQIDQLAESEEAAETGAL